MAFENLIKIYKNKAVIYKLISPSNKVYIGQTINLKRRFESYISLNCKGQIKLYNALVKYGFSNFKIEILDSFDIESDKDIKSILNESEMKNILLFNSFKNGYNMTLGGDSRLGSIVSEKTKRKLSIALTGRRVSDETREKIRNSNVGLKRSKETIEKLKNRKYSKNSKKKMSESQKGNKNHLGKSHSKETKNKISLTKKKSQKTYDNINNLKIINKNNKYNLDNTIYLFYHSKFGYERCTQSELRKKYNLTKEISSVIKGRQKSHRGWKLLEAL